MFPLHIGGNLDDLDLRFCEMNPVELNYIFKCL
jgi:hypothetical protein